MGRAVRFAVDRIVRCIAGDSCAGVETLSAAAVVFLERRYGLRFDGGVCPLCGRAFRSLYVHYLRSGCGAVLRALLREFVEAYARWRGLCARGGGGRVVCRVCRRGFGSVRDCVVHLLEAHLDEVEGRG